MVADTVTRSLGLTLLLTLLVAGLAGAGAQQPAPSSAALATITDVTCDGSDRCWFATWAGVSVHLGGEEWVSFSAANSPLAHDYCHDVAPQGENLIWIAHHYSGGIDLLDHNGTPAERGDDRWLNFPLADVLPEGYGWVEVLYVDSAGRKWLGHGAGASVLDDGGTPFERSDDVWTNYTSENAPLAPGFVNAIVEDGAGCLWLGGDSGPLAHLCGAAWDSVTWPGVDNCFSCCWTWPKWVWELAVDEEGTVWLADGSCGLAWYDGLKWSFCDVHDASCGLPDAPVNGSDLGVRAVAVDGSNIWVGTRGRGAARRDGAGHWTEYPAATCDWLGSDQIETIAFDSAGRGWFGSLDAGAFRYLPPQSSSVVIGPAGGSLAAPDGALSVHFPEGALSESTRVTYQKAHAGATGELVAVYAFTLEAQRESDGSAVTEFARPYTLTLAYAAADNKAVIARTLAFYTWDGNRWLKEASSSVDAARKLVSATPDHMSLFAVLGESHRSYLPLVCR